MTLLLLILGAFLLGSVPFGAVIARIKGINLRKVGSGNIGTTNVLRSVGKFPALLTLILDVLKGTVPVLAAQYLSVGTLPTGIVGLSAVAGHNFSVFLRLRGGKGVATSIGVLLAYAPRVALVTIAVWVLVALVTRYSSLGALTAFSVLPVTMYFLDPERQKILIAVVMAALLILKHVANIQRLIHGTESKIGEKI